MSTKIIKTITMLVVGFVFLVGLSAVSYAGGYPILAFTANCPNSPSPDCPDFVVVGKFDSADFSYADAQGLSMTISSLVSSFLGSYQVLVFTPNDLSPYGFTDADTLKNLVYNVYPNYFLLYIFLDINRTNSPQPAIGKNIAIDIWLADVSYQLGINEPYLYIATIEVPELYLSLF